MTGALLYKPKQSWRVGLAFVAATLIHFAAVVIAGIAPDTQVEQVSPGHDDFPIVDLIDPSPPIDEPTLPPEDVDPIPTPHLPDELFVDERPIALPARRPNDKRVAPIVRARDTGAVGVLNLSSARILALHAPRPEYPYEARRQEIIGDGIVLMTVNPVSGRVTDVSMWKSTGSPVLDNATLTGFRRWRFKPGTASRVKSPITFTMVGAQY